MGSHHSKQNGAFNRPVKHKSSKRTKPKIPSLSVTSPNGTTSKVPSPKPTTYATIAVKEVIRGPAPQPAPEPARELSPEAGAPARKRDSIVTLAEDDVINDWVGGFTTP